MEVEEALPQAWVLVCSSVAWDLVVQPMGVGQRMEADLDWCFAWVEGGVE